MADYQEAPKSAEKTSKDSINKSKVQNKSSVQNAGACPNCGAAIPNGALFCAECGFDFKQPLFCPNCGAKTSPGADICQVCKTWLLEGKCKFCYAELPPEAAFCPVCGNPKDGIVCPNCGKLSIFDFCSSCGKPLTENAIKTLELAKDDPDAKEIIDAVNQTANINSELAELEKLLNSETAPDAPDESAGDEPAPAPERKSLFSDTQLSAIMKMGENRDTAVQNRIEEEKKAEEKARLAEEEERKRQEQQRLAKLKQDQARKEALEKQQAKAAAALNAIARKYAAKRFSTHQEARCWYLSHKFPNAIGWLCNYTGTVHLYPEGPNECGEPALGGCDYFGEVVKVSEDDWERWIPKT